MSDGKGLFRIFCEAIGGLERVGRLDAESASALMWAFGGAGIDYRDTDADCGCAGGDAKSLILRALGIPLERPEPGLPSRMSATQRRAWEHYERAKEREFAAVARRFRWEYDRS